MPSSSTRNTRSRQLPFVLGENRKEVAGLIQALLSPASANAASLAQALLAFRRSKAAPVLAAALHYRLHGGEIYCPRCADPAPLLMAAVSEEMGGVEIGKIEEVTLNLSHMVYKYALSPREPGYPQGLYAFVSAAVLALVGQPDKAAYVARVAHNNDHRHGARIRCMYCSRR